jgi:hypothetical protein
LGITASALASQKTKPKDSQMSFEQEWAGVLNQAQQGILDHVALRDDDAALIAACWVAATHISDAMNYAPRLAIKAPTKGCGKTTLLSVVERLVNSPDMSVLHTQATLFRSYPLKGHTDIEPPTLLIDEAANVFGVGKKERSQTEQDLEIIVNAGFRRGVCVPRCVGRDQKVIRFHTFGFIALAGIGNYLPDMTHSRSISVWLDRTVSKKLKPNRDHYLDINLLPIRTNLEALKDSALEAVLLKKADPDYLCPQPDEITDMRRHEVWESLFEVADLAGEIWGRRIRQAAIRHEQTHNLPEAQPLHMKLLFDSYEVSKKDEGDPFWITSEDLVGGLKRLNAEDWDSDLRLTKNKLARELGQSGIRSTKRRIHGTAGIACYEKAAIEASALKYLSDLDDPTATNSQHATEAQPESLNEYAASEDLLSFDDSHREAAGTAVATARDPFAGGW